MVNYHPLTTAMALCALYNKAKVQGLGILQYKAGDMPLDEAKELVSDNDYFDYVYGRVLKVRLSKDSQVFDERFYDRDNGEGAAQKDIEIYKNEMHEKGLI